MIWTQDCSIIATLTQPNERGAFDYWPNERRENYQGLIVDCATEFDMTHYMLREFKLTHAEVIIHKNLLSLKNYFLSFNKEEESSSLQREKNFFC